MRRTAFLAFVLGLAAVGEGLWIWQLRGAARTASIEVRATNAGVELAPEDARVFIGPADRGQGDVVEGPLEQRLEVAPGAYDIRVLFSRSSDQQEQSLEPVTVAAGERLIRTIEFGSGELNVRVPVGETAGTAVVYVFAHGDRDRVITSMPADQPALIAPGAYDLRVVLVEGSEEKQIRWREQVPVKAGMQTRVQVPFERGALLLRARNSGEALPGGAVEVTVYRAGDDDRALLETGTAHAEIALAAGRYDVKAVFVASHDRPERWLRDLRIEADTTLEQVVEFASGTVVVEASLEDGAPLDRFDAYVYYYPAGDHMQPIAYTTTPDPAVLGSGRYDLRVSFHRSHDRPDIWIRGLELGPGQRIVKRVAFASGHLLVRAFDLAGNELIGDTVFVYVHAAGERSRPLAVARSGEIITLGAGRYDVGTVDSRRPGTRQWLAGVQVQPGRLAEHSVVYAD